MPRRRTITPPLYRFSYQRQMPGQIAKNIEAKPARHRHQMLIRVLRAFHYY